MGVREDRNNHSAIVLSPFMASRATLALNDGVYCLRFILSPFQVCILGSFTPYRPVQFLGSSSGILKAQGYTTYVSPEGPDKGIDLLAAPGALGFGKPRICVQVKSQDTPVDRPTMDQLIGTMQNVQAEQGLLVSWGGYKSSVNREEASQFFRVRLWDRDDLIRQLLPNFDKLDDGLI